MLDGLIVHSIETTFGDEVIQSFLITTLMGLHHSVETVSVDRGVLLVVFYTTRLVLSSLCAYYYPNNE